MVQSSGGNRERGGAGSPPPHGEEEETRFIAILNFWRLSSACAAWSGWTAFQLRTRTEGILNRSKLRERRGTGDGSGECRMGSVEAKGNLQCVTNALCLEKPSLAAHGHSSYFAGFYLKDNSSYCQQGAEHQS